MTLAPCLRAISCALLAATPLAAQDTDLANRLLIELNAAQPQDDGCKLSFLVQNGHATDIGKAVFETVLFDASGQVDRLTLFDFGALPAGRPRVRQFVIPGTACDGISQILFNGASTCEAGDLGPAACTGDLLLDSRTDTEVTG